MNVLRQLWSMEFASALLGAFVGGLFTLVGAWFQTRRTEKAAVLALARTNAQRAFDTLTQLRALLEAQPPRGLGTPEARDAWNREQQALITTANSSIMLLPDQQAETRQRSLLLLRKIKSWQGLTLWPDYGQRAGRGRQGASPRTPGRSGHSAPASTG